MQQLLNAVTAGREVDMFDVLKHELSPVPLSLAKTTAEMNNTPKSELIIILTNDIQIYNTTPNSDLKTCVLIDGHAIGKPHGCDNFGNYAHVFLQTITRYFTGPVTGVDVVFDRYIEKSIETAARVRRQGKKKSIRKLIDGPDIKLPQSWDQYLALGENKAELANFLSEQLMEHCKHLDAKYELVVGGGFNDIQYARSTRSNDIDLHSSHEEADTRLILHACNAAIKGYYRVIVVSRDTYVLLLLAYFLPDKLTEVWMQAGTHKQPKCLFRIIDK